MNLKTRLSKLENKMKYYHIAPVLFVKRVEEINQHQESIDNKTVIFIDDVPEEDDPVH